MRALIIGGSGTISSYVVKALLEKKWEVWVLNRGTKRDRIPEGVNLLVGDIKNEKEVEKLLGSRTFDTVSDFVAFTLGDVERDYRLFRGGQGSISSPRPHRPTSSPVRTISLPRALRSRTGSGSIPGTRSSVRVTSEAGP